MTTSTLSAYSLAIVGLHLVYLKVVLKFIRGKEINIKDPFKNGDFVLEEPPINDTFLEKEEFMQLNKIFLKEVPIGSTDFYPMAMFIFCCLTGLRIGDVLSLNGKGNTTLLFHG